MSDLMHPYELFGIECGKGWKSLYQPILDKVEEINKDNPDPIQILQVKEKYGRLDIYLSRYENGLLEDIMKASEQSSRICEECGDPAIPRTVNGWVYQLCDKCYDKFELRTKELLESYESKFKPGEENISKETD